MSFHRQTVAPSTLSIVACLALGLVACPSSKAPEGGQDSRDGGVAADAASAQSPAGEVVHTDKRGRQLTRSDLEEADALLEDLPYERNVPDEARELYKKGQEAGKARRFDEALDHFIQARIVTRSWPAPAYAAGWTYLF